MYITALIMQTENKIKNFKKKPQKEKFWGENKKKILIFFVNGTPETYVSFITPVPIEFELYIRL